MSYTTTRRLKSAREQRGLRQAPQTAIQSAQLVVDHNLGTLINYYGERPGEESRSGTPMPTAPVLRDGQIVTRNDVVQAIERIFETSSRAALVGPAGSG
jgi:hypothetical protein